MPQPIPQASQNLPQIEGYQVTHKIGEGGVGLVYSALDLTGGQLVAIKVLKQTLAESEATSQKLTEFKENNSTQSSSWLSASINAQRLFQELVTTTRIRHPNVVKILDFGISEQQELYVVMELLVGDNMSTFLKENKPLPLSLTLNLFKEVLEAIGSAHRQQIIHQDIKPSNLFILRPDLLERPTSQERPKLVVMDFGIARRVRHQQSDQNLVGSLPYMAPEYLQHQIASATGDVYQLGLTLIELITGVRVIQGKGGMQIMYQHITGETQINEALKRGPLGDVLARSIALDPAERYHDAYEFLTALTAIPQEEIHRVELDLSGGLQNSAIETPALILSSAPSALSPPMTTPSLSVAPSTVAPPTVAPPTVAPPTVAPPTVASAFSAPPLSAPPLIVPPPLPHPNLSSSPLPKKTDTSSQVNRDLREFVEWSDMRAELDQLKGVSEAAQRQHKQLILGLLVITTVALLSILAHFL